MDQIFQYVFSLGKRLFFLALIISAPPMALAALGYPQETVTGVFGALYLLSLPWLLWFQQMYYLGIGHRGKGQPRSITALFSSLFCAVALFLLFPSLPASGRFPLQEIPPHPRISQEQILAYPEGTLILEPSKMLPAGAENAAALFYGARKLAFNSYRTNGETLRLIGPEPLEAPFLQEYPKLNASLLSRWAASLWLDNILRFHRNWEDYALQLGAKYELHISEDLDTIFPQTREQKERPDKAKYLQIFLSLWAIYLFAGLIGVILSLGQQYLGALTLLSLTVWGAADKILISIQNLFLKSPFPPLAEALLGALSFLGIALICDVRFPAFKEKRR